MTKSMFDKLYTAIVESSSASGVHPFQLINDMKKLVSNKDELDNIVERLYEELIVNSHELPWEF